jgi:hypothetical protein
VSPGQSASGPLIDWRGLQSVGFVRRWSVPSPEDVWVIVALFWLLFVAWFWPMEAGAFTEVTGQGNEGRASVGGLGDAPGEYDETQGPATCLSVLLVVH